MYFFFNPLTVTAWNYLSDWPSAVVVPSLEPREEVVKIL